MCSTRVASTKCGLDEIWARQHISTNLLWISDEMFSTNVVSINYGVDNMSSRQNIALTLLDHMSETFDYMFRRNVRLMFRQNVPIKCFDQMF